MSSLSICQDNYGGAFAIMSSCFQIQIRVHLALLVCSENVTIHAPLFYQFPKSEIGEKIDEMRGVSRTLRIGEQLFLDVCHVVVW